MLTPLNKVCQLRVRRLGVAVAGAVLLTACSGSSSKSSAPTTADKTTTTSASTTSGSSSSSQAPTTTGSSPSSSKAPATTGTSIPRRKDTTGRVATATVGTIAGASRAAPGPGYVEQELTLAGTAFAYKPERTLQSDGRWAVVPAGAAHYTTRMLVRRPIDPKRFNGTVVVEWMNVSAGTDIAPDWGFAHTELMRDGFAWVGVSAQKIGIDAAKKSEPERYRSLSHPGDQFSYDIYSQAGNIIGHPTKVDPLPGLPKARRLIADGESQSAIRMTSYVNAVHVIAEVYDGFLIHSRFAAGAPLGVTGEVPGPKSTQIRTDLDVPVLVVSSETDVGFNHSTRQPDSSRYRLWEIAGTAHADSYVVGGAIAGTGSGVETPRLGICKTPINSAPQYQVVNAAIWSLNRWIAEGVEPSHAPRLTLKPGEKGVPQRDRYGNALGGIRLPQLEVPTLTLSGGGNSGGAFCTLFGSTTRLRPTVLKALYPSHATYVRKFTKAAQSLQRQGFILRPDVKAAIRSAQQSRIGR